MAVCCCCQSGVGDEQSLAHMAFIHAAAGAQLQAILSLKLAVGHDESGFVQICLAGLVRGAEQQTSRDVSPR